MVGLYDQGVHVVYLLEPKDLGSSTTATDVVGVKEYSWIQFVCQIGAITGNAVIYLYESTSTTASGSALAATYRLTSAVGTDSPGAVTTLTTSGLTLTDGTDENKAVLIDVDPATLTAGYSYLFLSLDPGSVLLASVVALLKPRFPQETNLSAVD